MAVWRRGKPDALMHHSDRGSQYATRTVPALMADSGIVFGMSRSSMALLRRPTFMATSNVDWVEHERSFSGGHSATNGTISLGTSQSLPTV
jgi:transposase InsO family protein